MSFGFWYDQVIVFWCRMNVNEVYRQIKQISFKQSDRLLSDLGTKAYNMRLDVIER